MKKKQATGSEEVLTYIAEKVTEVLKRRGVQSGTIAAAALAVSDGIAEQFGGLTVYFKKGVECTVEERKLAIRADFATPDEQGRLIVAEGIESALAASALFGLPAAAALSAHGMAVFEWPPETRELFIAADNDGNGTGIQAAEKLARRALLEGIKANIWQPEQTDTDALDELNRRQTKGETS